MIASQSEAPVDPMLAYELPAPSTAVVERKQHCRAYPSSASTLSLAGTRTVRIRLGGEGFIDPTSVRLQYTIVNGGAWMRPYTGPWGVWGTVRLLSGGCELDHVYDYGRFHQQYFFNQLSMAEQWGSAAVEGMHMSAPATSANAQPRVGEINGGSSFTCMHKLGLSLFSSGKLIPVKFAPLEVELTLRDTITDWLNPGNSGSTSFSLADVQILYDSMELDEAVQNALFSSLLKNRVLSIPTVHAHQMVFPIAAGSTSISFSAVRAFSRLSQVWLTFRKTGPRSTEFICPGPLPGIGDSSDTTSLKNEAVPQVRLSIGPMNLPNPSPVSTMAEYYYLMTKSLGYSPNITRYGFEKEAFTICFDLKKLPHDILTSISTRSGDLLRVEVTNMVADQVNECWLTAFAFGVVAVRESGVSLLT